MIDPEHPIAAAMGEHILHRIWVIWFAAATKACVANRVDLIGILARDGCAVVEGSVIDANYQLTPDPVKARKNSRKIIPAVYGHNKDCQIHMCAEVGTWLLSIGGKQRVRA